MKLIVSSEPELEIEQDADQEARQLVAALTALLEAMPHLRTASLQSVLKLPPEAGGVLRLRRSWQVH